MIDSQIKEFSILADAYESLAFRGSSVNHLTQVTDEVTHLANRGNIYPPAFAMPRERIPEYGISTQSHNENEGTITPAEAVAMQVLADEVSAIAQNLYKSPEKTKFINQITGAFGGCSSDVVFGLSDLGYQLINAAKIRDRITQGKSIPTERTIGAQIERDWWQRYQTPLQLDGMIIGNHTVVAAAKTASEIAERQITNNSEGAKDKSEVENRIKSRLRGIEVGAKIYQQVLDIVIQRGLSITLEKTAGKK